MIFEDVSGKRRKWAIRGLVLISVLIAVPLVAFLLGLQLRPHFPGLSARKTEAAPSVAPSPRPRAAPRARPSGFVFAAHDDPPGARAIDEHIDRIDVIVPDWFRLPGPGCTIEETIDDASRAWASRSDVRVVARLANLSGDAWAKADAGAMLRNPETRACVARSVAARAEALGARGINVDLESLAPADADGLVAFMGELRAALGSNRLLTIDVTPDDPAYDLSRLGAIADAVVLMAYDEHEETSAPGPIASPDWFGAVVDRALTRVPRERLLVGVGSYCYDWSRTTPPVVDALPYGAAMERATAFSSLPVFHRATGGTTFTYDDKGAAHEVWCSDAAAVHNQLMMLRSRGLERWALWRAGSEDPSLWATVSAESSTQTAAALRTIPAPADVTVYGAGDAWTMVSAPTPGQRDVTFDDDGSVRDASYRAVPTARRFQLRGGNARREIVLTFDDGPDPRFTPMILDALRTHGAEATFFVLGEQATSHADLVRRIGREGHLLGNHTFHHPHVDQIGEAGLLRELRSTERVLEGLLGHYTPLFRAPYTAAFDARSPDLLASHLPAFEAGYTVVGGDVDPADWSTPGADVIAERIVAGAESGGRIVVLHDGGGDRTQTVDALGIAIPELRRRGYSIVPLDRHLDLPRATIAPPVDAHDEAIASGARAASFLSSQGPSLLGVLFSVCTTLAALRVVMLIVLALKRRRDATPAAETHEEPLVTVLVPAFNEEKVLRSTVRSLLASDYRRIEVLVIDDGSTDDTFAVGRALALEDRRVRCLRKRNGGKAAAANYGTRHARGEIIVSVDADTMVAPDAVRMLVRRFADPKVSAVCGNVEVGNVRSLLTAFQAIEYVTSQNLDRRALAAVNAVNVVPGALGAWRREVLLSVGGYAKDTLVEDADLTLTVLRAGGRIEYEPKAVARTEAPETLAALWKQRFRWTYGTYQCLAKHRSGLFHGPSGMIALPNMVLFQVVFPLLSPIGDAVMLLALLSGSWGSVLSGYLGFLAMDVFASVIAFRLDRKPLRWLPLLLIQRFTYRQFMYLVCLRALVAAVSGGRHGWRKLERTGAVSVPSIAPVAKASEDAKLVA